MFRFIRRMLGVKSPGLKMPSPCYVTDNGETVMHDWAIRRSIRRAIRSEVWWYLEKYVNKRKGTNL